MDRQEEEDFSSLSIIERLQHKLWKARVSACEELTKLFHTTVDDSDFYTYEPHLKKLVIEPNAVAQEAGLTALFEYVTNAPNATSTREVIIPALVEKGLSAMKAGAKQKATDTILLYAELDTPNPVIELVLPGTNAKQPKLITQTVLVLKELVRQFGIHKVSPKPIIKTLPKLFGHTDKNVRAETFQLTVELYRWIGPALLPSLSSLKPVQLKDLEKAFESLPKEKPVPERLIRAEQAQAHEKDDEEEEEQEPTADPAEDDDEEMEVEEMDPYDFADPKDITAHLPSNFYELLTSKKWQERKEALDALTEEAKTPKILDTDYSELISALAKRINDANVLLVAATAHCVELIANGLRTDFSKYKPILAPVMIEKLKERKPAVLEQLTHGLHAVFATVPLSELVDDVTVASKHKNPQVRAECFKLLSRRLREVKEMPAKTEIKAFADMFKKLLDDSDAHARDAGAEGLGTLMKLIGEKPMLLLTEGLDDIKMKKIKEVCDHVTVKATSAKKPARPPSKPKAPLKSAAPAQKKKVPAAPLKKPTSSAPAPAVAAAADPMAIDRSIDPPHLSSPPKRKPPSKWAGAGHLKKPALSSAAKTRPFPPSAVPSAATHKAAPTTTEEEEENEEEEEEENDDMDFEMDPYDLADPKDITEKLPSNVYALLVSKKWQERKEALEAIAEQAKTPKILDIDYTELMTALAQRINDANVLLVATAAQCIQSIATGLRADFAKYKPLVAPAMIEKLKERKPAVLEQLTNGLNAVFATVPLSDLVEDVTAASHHKNPQVRAEIFKLISRRLREVKEMPAKTEIKVFADMLKKLLDDSDAHARDAAAEGLGTLMKLIGEKPMLLFTEGLDDIKMKKIKDVCDKVTVKARPATKKAKPTPTPTPTPTPARARAPASASPSSRAPAKTLTSPALKKKVPSSMASKSTAPPPSKPRPASADVDPMKSTATTTTTTTTTTLPHRMKATTPSLSKKRTLPSSSSAASTTSPARSQAGTTADTSTAASPPILTHDPRAKLMRAKKEIRWQFDLPPPEFVDRLHSLFDAHFSRDLTSLLFSKSQYAEKDRLNGLTQLNACLEAPDLCDAKYGLDPGEIRQRFLANADLIFKYLTLRFYDTNTSMLIQCLDMTQHLVTLMEQESCPLSEYEAASFLPFLIHKVGDPKEVMRKRIRHILHAICNIYPPPKLFNYLLDSTASSKNAKARAECLEQVGSLIQTHGMSVMLPQKALPAVATHIGDKDAGVRNAALAAIAQAYILMGDPVMKYMTQLGAKEKSMLEERLKRTKPSASVLAQQEKEQRAKQEAEEMEVDPLPSLPPLPRKPGSSGKARSGIATPKRVSQPYVHSHHTIPDSDPMEDMADDHGRRLPDPPLSSSRHAPPMRYQPLPPSNLYQQQQPQPQQPQQQQQSMPTTYDSQRDYLDYLIPQITSSDAPSSIEALKNLDKMLLSHPDLIQQEISRLIMAIALQIRLAYSNMDSRQPMSVRLCKHLVNALVLLFSNKAVAQSIPHEALHNLLNELAFRLLDQNMLSVESGGQLSKALNVAMVKILENSSRNVTLSALLTILNDASSKLRPHDQPNSLQTKYTELIMKCLWKLAKTIQDSLRTNSLNPDHLLFEINEFFITTPPAEWKRRAADNVPLGEMPLRTVKTLLLELVNGLGPNIFQHLSLISEPQKSSVYPYLHHMLEACRRKGASTHPSTESSLSPMQPPPPSSPQQQPPPPQQHASPDHHYLSHSRHASMDRPSSMSPYPSETLHRSPSLASHHSSTVEGEPPSDGLYDTKYASPVHSHPAVQPMQIDTPPTHHQKSAYPSEYELNLMLTKIFRKIGDRELTKQGVIELYEFQKKYPNAESRVKVFLNQTTPFFKSYIQRCLSNLEAEDEELHAAAASEASAAVASAAANVSRFTAERHSQIFTVTTTSSSSKRSATATSPSSWEQEQQPQSPSPMERHGMEDPPVRPSSISHPQQLLQKRLDSRASDDTAEIKLRLLRLQQKFGYRTEVEEGTTSVNAGLTTTSNTVSQAQDASLVQAASTRQPSLFQDNYQGSLKTETDRQQALKDKIAKMKQVIHSAASSSDRQ
ncbi:armadillo-type protein [Mycotypha africana]|uniref:armadillo-type protein n=1 Tax=Mycotypha africana TaxID=64632 RepID=UPI0023011E3E|nr:armadillo-type protein [Mycotypha africana]KAI8967762.1 armadillo-type protein [Mycotypha africana]